MYEFRYGRDGAADYGTVPKRLPTNASGGTVEGHLPVQKTWDCNSCDRPWPCTVAKERLLVEYQGAPTALITYMSFQMTAAIDDMPREAEEAFYERFIGWARVLRHRLV